MNEDVHQLKRVTNNEIESLIDAKENNLRTIQQSVNKFRENISKAIGKILNTNNLFKQFNIKH